MSPEITPLLMEEYMRTRKQIEQDGTRVDILTLEVLLDIRDLLKKKKPPKGKNKVKE